MAKSNSSPALYDRAKILQEECDNFRTCLAETVLEKRVEAAEQTVTLLRAVLKGYEAWEAALIEDDEAWISWHGASWPVLVAQHYDTWLRLQGERNRALYPTPDTNTPDDDRLPTLVGIVVDWLRSHGYDGLVCDFGCADECYCTLDRFMPCHCGAQMRFTEPMPAHRRADGTLWPGPRTEETQ